MIKCCADNFKKVAHSLTLSPQDPVNTYKIAREARLLTIYITFLVEESADRQIVHFF